LNRWQTQASSGSLKFFQPIIQTGQIAGHSAALSKSLRNQESRMRYDGAGIKGIHSVLQFHQFINEKNLGRRFRTAIGDTTASTRLHIISAGTKEGSILMLQECCKNQN
jgi:hypothetical protein